MRNPVVDATLAALPGLTVRSSRHLPERGRFYPEHQVVLTRSGMTGPQWAATVVHEAIHAERGDGPCCSPWHDAKQERLVEIETARRLVTITALLDGLLWTRDDDELAEKLGVDVDLLRCRLGDAMTDGEYVYLQRRLAAAERYIA